MVFFACESLDQCLIRIYQQSHFSQMFLHFFDSLLPTLHIIITLLETHLQIIHLTQFQLVLLDQLLYTLGLVYYLRLIFDFL